MKSYCELEKYDLTIPSLCIKQSYSYNCTSCGSVKGHENESYNNVWYCDTNTPSTCQNCTRPLNISSVLKLPIDIEIKKMTEQYFDRLSAIINNPKYILLNKLEVLHHIFNYTNNTGTLQIYPFQNTIPFVANKSNWIQTRIIKHPKFHQLIMIFYKKFLGKMLFPYDEPVNLTFLSPTEMMYVSEKNDFDILS
jgi:hypothetical protein